MGLVDTQSKGQSKSCPYVLYTLYLLHAVKISLILAQFMNVHGYLLFLLQVANDILGGLKLSSCVPVELAKPKRSVKHASLSSGTWYAKLCSWPDPGGITFLQCHHVTY